MSLRSFLPTEGGLPWYANAEKLGFDLIGDLLSMMNNSPDTSETL